ncbi:MAG: hypothetical protein QGG64_08185, partial [Candidatus Latescibacteria bacterium]|nr:hypothetical protein [Candidatus Latescibacterota bacterium]
ATKDLLRSGSSKPVVAIKKSDGPTIRRLYNQLNATRTVSHVRPNYWTYFEGNFRILPGTAKPLKAVVTHNPRGKISGYAALSYNEEKYVVSEIDGRSINDFKSLAAYIGKSARRKGIDLVEFRLPHDHPFATYCATLGCNWEIEHPRNHGVMARITNLQILFKNLEKELTRRIQKSDLNTPALLGIETDIGSISLNLKPSSVQISEAPSKHALRITISQMPLTQLIMGYRSAEDIANGPDVFIPPKALPILSALFPKTIGYIWWSDRF